MSNPENLEQKIEEQEAVLKNDKKNMLVSASAGSGKTYIMIKYITKLICEKKVPINNLLVLTFTKAAANEMKERLERSLKEQGQDDFIVEQIDALTTSNISTIHAFCEKMIKKYANLLEISENFQIMDESYSQQLRFFAVDNALKELKNESEEDYLELIGCYKNDKNKICDHILEIENLLNSVAYRDKFLDDLQTRNENYFALATDYLLSLVKNQTKNLVKLAREEHILEFETHLDDSLFDILNAKDIVQLSQKIDEFVFPKIPPVKEIGQEANEKLKNIKANLTKLFEKISSLNLTDQENIDFQKIGRLEKILLKLFKNYEKIEKNAKKSQNLLDFYDLEKYMNILSSQENLFSGIKYVFIDEYQDTNKVQETIVKKLAKNCNFVAVGDAKQGIYGFRLASAEIFLNDIDIFENDENSTVKYLQSNFRSNQKVLDFVNDVFKKSMTKQSCGIEYFPESMLKGRAKFLDDGQKSVFIDVVNEKTEQKEKSLPKVYSVKNAEVVVENKSENMLLDIKRRILECLSSNISDKGVLRPCKFSDIAILSRSRSPFFKQLSDFLQENEIPVVSNSRDDLFDESEMQMLKNFLKISLCFDDDLALLSVITSALCGCSMQEVADEKIDESESLCEIVKNSLNPKIVSFLNNLSAFKLDSQVYGIKTALEMFFAKTNYRASLNLRPEHIKLNMFLDKFLGEIARSGYDFDLPSLLTYFETAEIPVVPEPSESSDAILLTTIHNSKGLEYPIVFLIGCDASLKSQSSKNEIQINEKFGLGVKFYDQDANIERNTAKLLAIKEMEAHKDFVEELMIFYVALTRAKNRLYLFGKNRNFKTFSLENCDSYFDLIFYSNPEILKNLLENDKFETDTLSAKIIDEVEQISFGKKQNAEHLVVDEQMKKDMKDYLEFEYKIDDFTNFKLKESVTSLSQKQQEDALAKYSNDNFNFSSATIEVGNAYHLALKLCDFEKINSVDDLGRELDNFKDELKDSLDLINIDILYKNIFLLKKLTQNADKIFKEKEFIMKEPVSKFLPNAKTDERVLVQGIIDLFVIKDQKIRLVDYKFSNSQSDEYLIEKYSPQLRAYKIALEDALSLLVENVYLLSLKNFHMIKVEI